MRDASLPRDLLRRSLRHDAAAAFSALRAEIDDPIRFGNDVQIVLDDDDRVAAVDESLQHLNQLLRIRHMQPDRGFIEHVKS